MVNFVFCEFYLNKNNIFCLFEIQIWLNILYFTWELIYFILSASLIKML